MKRRMGTTGRTQLASSQVYGLKILYLNKTISIVTILFQLSCFSLILVGLLLIGRPVLAEKQDGRDLQSGNTSRNELFSDICMMRPPQRPEPDEESPANFKKAKEERIRKLQLEMGYCMIEASKDHPYVAALIVILICFAACFCWMFWFDLMVFTLVFVILCDNLSELFDHQLLHFLYGYLRRIIRPTEVGS